MLVRKVQESLKELETSDVCDPRELGAGEVGQEQDSVEANLNPGNFSLRLVAIAYILEFQRDYLKKWNCKSF